MKLQPVTKSSSETAYPERKASLFHVTGRWVKRVGAVAAAATAFWISGCLIPLGGVMVEPEYFVCSETSPESPPLLPGYGTFSSHFCDGQQAWTGIDVDEQHSVQIAIDTDESCSASVWVFDPEGNVVAEVEANEPEVRVDLTEGRWLVGVERGEFCESWDFDFTISSL